MSLRARFADAIEAHRGLALNPYLQLALPAIKYVEAHADSVSALRPYVDELEEMILHNPDIAIDGLATNKLMQKLGEAHFLAICADRGVPLAPIPEMKNLKTPDFSLQDGAGPLHFEVKTLSVVGGDQGIHEALQETLKATIEIDDQIRDGRKVAIGESVIAPYGPRTRCGTLFRIADVILEKARSNVKQDQYSRPNTFLVINTSLLPTLPGGPGNLRRQFHYRAPHECKVSGALWNVAFGSPGDPFIDIPEFEGDDRNIYIFDKRGVLVDDEFDAVAGLLFLTHPWSKPAELWGLWRSRSEQQWTASGIRHVISALPGDLWNDELEQNSNLAEKLGDT